MVDFICTSLNIYKHIYHSDSSTLILKVWRGQSSYDQAAEQAAVVK